MQRGSGRLWHSLCGILPAAGRRLGKLLPLLTAVYIGTLLLAWAVCDRIIFPVEPPAYRLGDPDIITIPSSGGGMLPALWLPRSEARWTLLYCHANAEDIGAVRADMEEWRQKLGLAVLAVEYPGYGRAPGTPSEAGCYLAALAGYEYLRDRVGTPPNRIVVFGRSLGGGVAVDLASRRQIGALILESTFLSAFRVRTGIRLFPIDRFNSYAKIHAVRCPVLLFHGDADQMIPLRQGKALLEAATAAKSKHLVVVPGAGHHDVPQR
ncbi:MAG: alpha/beta hydrolase, partial [Planctomycetes bacterium]|nr:alpha/beta hydrolase [Planctomycetota bacterium]